MIPIDHSQYIKSQIYQKVFVEIISEVKKKKKMTSGNRKITDIFAPKSKDNKHKRIVTTTA